MEQEYQDITRPREVREEVKKLRKKFLRYQEAEVVYSISHRNRAEITIHQVAKKRFDALGTKKITRVKELSAEYAEILAEKKQAYQEYREARSEMKKNMIIQKNMAMLTGRESVPERNAQPSHEVR